MKKNLSNIGVLGPILVFIFFSTIILGTTYFNKKIKTLEKNIKDIIISIESEKVGGMENYQKIKKIYNTEVYKQDQSKKLDDTLKMIEDQKNGKLLGEKIDNKVVEKDNSGNTNTEISNNENEEFKGNKFLSYFINTAGKIANKNLLKNLKQDSYFMGKENSKYSLFSYSEMECPYCRKFHKEETLKSFIHNKDINLFYKHFPLDSIHPNARKGGQAAECITKLSKEKDKSKVFYNVLNDFYSSPNFRLENKKELINTYKISEKDFKDCLVNNKTFNEKITNNIQNGITLFNIKSVPSTVLVNNETLKYVILEGGFPLEAFEEAYNYLEMKE